MTNFFFGEHNDKLKQAAKQRPLLRLYNLRKPGPAPAPHSCDFRKLLPRDLVPSLNVLEIPL